MKEHRSEFRRTENLEIVIPSHNSFINSVVFYFDSLLMVLILLQNIELFLMCPCHLRLCFLSLLNLFKRKYTNLTFYFPGKVTFMNLEYITGSLMCLFSARHALWKKALMIWSLQSGEIEERLSLMKWGRWPRLCCSNPNTSLVSWASYLLSVPQLPFPWNTSNAIVLLCRLGEHSGDEIHIDLACSKSSVNGSWSCCYYSTFQRVF